MCEFYPGIGPMYTRGFACFIILAANKNSVSWISLPSIYVMASSELFFPLSFSTNHYISDEQEADKD
jgi:hypothetical protein